MWTDAAMAPENKVGKWLLTRRDGGAALGDWLHDMVSRCLET